MDKDLVRRWINDLRYGGHKQGRMQLHVGDAYCCLGRALEVMYGPEIWDFGGLLADKSVLHIYRTPGETVYRNAQLSLDDMVRLGIQGIVMDLVLMNDSGIPFKEIADYIEAQLLPAEQAKGD